MPPAEPTTQDQPDSPGPDEPDSSPSSPGDRAAGIHVQVVDHADLAGTEIQGWLQGQICRAIELCNVQQAQLNLVVVADDEMAHLHEQYTGVPGTTDVLTFDLNDSGQDASPPGSNDPAPGSASQPAAIEADIILCLDEARRQATPRGHEPRHELLLYAVHGLMHLLGEDDHDDDAYERMHAREDALLEKMGIGPLFNPKSNTPDPRP